MTEHVIQRNGPSSQQRWNRVRKGWGAGGCWGQVWPPWGWLLITGGLYPLTCREGGQGRSRGEARKEGGAEQLRAGAIPIAEPKSLVGALRTSL